MRTHYENLKIAENAPAEVVRAAYRALSQRYHPDKNLGSKDAVRVMQVINDAYETLSDPVKRQGYDALLARARQAQGAAATPPPIQAHPRPGPTTSWWTNKRLFWATFWAWTLGLVLMFAEEQKTYDPNATYQVITYRTYRSGGRVQVGDPRIESGNELIQKEITRISTIHTIGLLSLGGAVVGTFAIFGRINSGQPMFLDAFDR